MKSVLFFAAFFILSALVGNWQDVIMHRFRAKGSRLFSIAFGGCLLIAFGMAVCLIGGAFGVSSDICAAVWAVLTAIATIAVIPVRKRIIPEKEPSRSFSAAYVIAGLAAAIAVALQIRGIYAYRFENTKVLSNVGIATGVFETGKLSLSDPMMLLIGTWSRIFGVHPLSFIYTVLPAAFVVFYYICCYEVICTVCTGAYRIVAFFALCAVNLRGYQSEALMDKTLLLSWFSTGVFVIYGLMSVAVVILIKYLANKPEKEKYNTKTGEEDLLEEWDMKKHRIINARNLAIGLGVLAAALVAVVFVLNSKINRLYDATVNLQEDLNRRCNIYEFAPDGGEAQGYLIKGENGKITFIGGGAAKNAEDLAAFISGYGTEIDKWYIYGDDEENAGAMRALTSNGSVTADKVYVITREEIRDIR